MYNLQTVYSIDVMYTGVAGKGAAGGGGGGGVIFGLFSAAKEGNERPRGAPDSTKPSNNYCAPGGRYLLQKTESVVGGDFGCSVAKEVRGMERKSHVPLLRRAVILSRRRRICVERVAAARHDVCEIAVLVHRWHPICIGTGRTNADPSLRSATVCFVKRRIAKRSTFFEFSEAWAIFPPDGGDRDREQVSAQSQMLIGMDESQQAIPSTPATKTCRRGPRPWRVGLHQSPPPLHRLDRKSTRLNSSQR